MPLYNFTLRVTDADGTTQDVPSSIFIYSFEVAGAVSSSSLTAPTLAFNNPQAAGSNAVSASQLSNVTMTPHYAASVNPLTSGGFISVPLMTYFFGAYPQPLVSGGSLSSPTLASKYALAANPVQSASSTTTPVVLVRYSLAGASLQSGSQASEPILILVYQFIDENIKPVYQMWLDNRYPQVFKRIAA